MCRPGPRVPRCGPVVICCWSRSGRLDAAAAGRGARHLPCHGHHHPEPAAAHRGSGRQMSGGQEPVTERLLLTVAEVAELLDLDRSQVYGLIRQGELASVRIRSCRRVPVAAVEGYQQAAVRERRVAVTAPTSLRRDPGHGPDRRGPGTVTSSEAKR